MAISSIRLLFFLFLIPLNWWSSRWLWDLVCRSADVTKQEVRAYRAQVHTAPRLYRYVSGWLTNTSPNPTKTSRLLFCYQISTIPFVLCVNLAVMGLFLFLFDPLFGYLTVIMPSVTAVLAICDFAYFGFWQKKRGSKTDGESARAAALSIADCLQDQSVDRHDPNKRKTIALHFFKLFITLLVLVCMVWFMAQKTLTPKTPASTEQVWDLLVSQGYAPQEIESDDTEQHAELLRHISVQEEDLFFHFYSFTNQTTAHDLYNRAHAMLLDAFQNVSAKTENTTVNSNYTVYSVRGSGLYAAVINVGATTVYTYCDVENADQLNRILYAIDYLPDEGDPT